MLKLASLLLAMGLIAQAAPRPQGETAGGPGRPGGRRQALLGSAFGIPGQNKTFDYVIIGGGTAGPALAARLAEDPSVTVALVEAGTFYELSNGNNTQIPIDCAMYTGKDVNDWHPGVDWGFVTTPQPGYNGAAVHYPRGKMLGGSSARNYMTYHGIPRGAHQKWADEVGDNSYTYENFYPYFKKSQNFSPPNNQKRFRNATPVYDASVLGRGGPLSTIFPNYAGAFGTWMLRGLAEIGVPLLREGFQSGKLMGAAYALATINIDTNTRDSAATAFLPTHINKDIKNLIIYVSTMGKRVIFDANRRATGVEVDYSGRRFTLSARREVILSAGAFQSPQLLMVSGVGPAAVLNQHNIPIVADRPGVGQNLQDHVLFGPSYRVNVITAGSFAVPGFADAAAEEFLTRGTGIMTSPGADVFAWEKVPQALRRDFSPEVLRNLAEFPEDWPEIEYLSPGAHFGYVQNLYRDAPNDGYNYGTFAMGIIAAKSVGNVSISSPDTAVQPVINPNWLTHPSDVALAVAAYKRARALWNSPSVRRITIGPEYFPGNNVTTDEQILDLIRQSTSTIYHAAASCKMGRLDDPMAVVDSRARVIGVTGLRVVDASAMPFLPPGHPLGVIYGLAEKIADDIRRRR